MNGENKEMNNNKQSLIKIYKKNLVFTLILPIMVIIMKLKSNKVEGTTMEELKTVKMKINADINDVADWFILKGDISNKKVQKLCYYAQAWSLALLNAPIATDAKFQAWVHGPVNKTLWNRFKEFGWGTFVLAEPKKVKEKLETIFNDAQKNILESVWETYGSFTADELEALTHKETPWLEKREGLGKFESCTRIISEKTMRNYYKSRVIE